MHLFAFGPSFLVDLTTAALLLHVEDIRGDIVESLTGYLRDRLRYLTVEQRDDRFLREVRKCQLEALRLLMQVFHRMPASTAGREGGGPNPANAIELGLRYVEETLKLQVELTRSLTRRWQAADTVRGGAWDGKTSGLAAEDGRNTGSSPQLFAEEALSELAHAVAPLDIPIGLEGCFAGRPDAGEPGWLDAYLMYLTWCLKTVPHFRAAIFPQILDQDEHVRRNANEILSHLYASGARIAHQFNALLVSPQADDEQKEPTPATASLSGRARAMTVASLDTIATSLAVRNGLDAASLLPALSELPGTQLLRAAFGRRLAEIAADLASVVDWLRDPAAISPPAQSSASQVAADIREGRFDRAIASLEQLRSSLSAPSAEREAGGPRTDHNLILAQAIIERSMLRDKKAAERMAGAADLVAADHAAERTWIFAALAETLQRMGEDRGSSDTLVEARRVSDLVLKSPLWGKQEPGIAPLHLLVGRLLYRDAVRSSSGTPLPIAISALELALDSAQHEMPAATHILAQIELADGKVHLALGQGKAASDQLLESVRALAGALEAAEETLDCLTLATFKARLAEALVRLSNWRGEIGLAELAVALYAEALQGQAWLCPPAELAPTYIRLGDALVHLGLSLRLSYRLVGAIAAYDRALDGFDEAKSPDPWGDVQTKLGSANIHLAILRKAQDGDVGFDVAAEHFRRAQRAHPRSKPFRWAQATVGLAQALLELGKMRSDTGPLDEAADLSRQIIAHTKGDSFRTHQARAHAMLGEVLCLKAEAADGLAAGLAELEKALPLAEAAGATGLVNQIKALQKKYGAAAGAPSPSPESTTVRD